MTPYIFSSLWHTRHSWHSSQQTCRILSPHRKYRTCPGFRRFLIQIFPQSNSVEIGIRIVVDGYDGCLRANEFTDLLQRLNRCMSRRMVVVVSLASFQARCRTCNQGLNKCICFLIISAQPLSTD